MNRPLSDSELDLIELYAVRLCRMEYLDPDNLNCEQLKSFLSQVRSLVDEIRLLRRRPDHLPDSRTIH